MVKDRFPRSQKSNRGHDRFKDLYAKEKEQTPATTPLTPELANRAPRQVVKSTTPSTDCTTTGNETTPVTKTPKKPNRPKLKKAKWSHVPSASDGEATHFENFENDGAQLAVAKMKTRELQWKSTESTDGTTTDGSTPESYRQEIDGTIGSSGSADELRLKPLEMTQEDREMTQEEPDQREIRNEPTLKIIPAKIQPSSENVKTVRLPPIVMPVVQPSKEVVKEVKEVKEVTKREQRKAPPTIKASAREMKKTTPSPTPIPQSLPSNNNKSVREEATKREHKQTGVKKKEEPTSANYLLAVKLMKILKRNNYLENSLRYEDSEKVRKHFESNGFNQNPPPQTVLFRADDLDTGITNDLRVFIIKKQEARVLMLEVILHRPDLMPTKWGGARAENKSKNSKSREGGKKGWFSFFR